MAKPPSSDKIPERKIRPCSCAISPNIEGNRLWFTSMAIPMATNTGPTNPAISFE
jgi:hypothetical protein